MAGRPKTRARKAQRARYENAGDYIRFKAERSTAYGPVRPELQPRWLNVKPAKSSQRVAKPSTSLRSSSRPSEAKGSRTSKNATCPGKFMEFKGRVVCLDNEVADWLRTGNGRGYEQTRGGTPASAKRDLEKALTRHFAIEKKNADLNARHGVDSKFETSSKLVNDEYGQGLWLWLATHNGSSADGYYPPNSISVSVDHG